MEQLSDELAKKVEFAIYLLKQAEQTAKNKGQLVELAYSGGKDSDVILELAKMAKIKYKAIYKNTTLDPSGTVAHCKANNVEIKMPKKNFLQLIKESGFPNAKIRHCCKYLKEYKIQDVAIIGIRRSESRRRMEKYKEPAQCRIYGNTPIKGRVEVFYPLLEWTDDDVLEFITKRGIKLHPHYYDENGVIHVERRLGCLCCPLKGRRGRINEFKQYPNMVKMYLRGARYYLQNHRPTSIHRKFKDEYQYFCQHLFCYTYDEFKQKFGVDSLFPTDCKQFLEDYFKIKL